MPITIKDAGIKIDHLPKPKESATKLGLEFINNCHSPEDGRFCGDGKGGGNSSVEHYGLDNFPDAIRSEILNTVSRLQDKYGVKAVVDARPSSAAGGKVTHYNTAQELDALMGVEPGETTIHVNPKMADAGWAKKQLSRKSFIAKNIEEAVTHEYGHSLNGALEQQNKIEVLAELARPFVRAASNAEVRRSLRNDVSFYASDNPSEGLAEAFLQHDKGIRNSWSDHTGSILEREFGRRTT